jgi:hypothetical protein
MIVKNISILLLLFFFLATSRGLELSNRALQSANDDLDNLKMKTDVDQPIFKEQPISHEGFTSTNTMQ